MKKIIPGDPYATGERLRAMRRRLHLTQTEMAERLNITMSHYSKVEIGARSMSPSLLSEVAAALGVSEAWIVHGEDIAAPTVADEKKVAEYPVAQDDIELFVRCVRDKWPVIEAGVNEFGLKLKEAIVPALKLYETKRKKE